MTYIRGGKEKKADAENRAVMKTGVWSKKGFHSGHFSVAKVDKAGRLGYTDGRIYIVENIYSLVYIVV